MGPSRHLRCHLIDCTPTARVNLQLQCLSNVRFPGVIMAISCLAYTCKQREGSVPLQMGQEGRRHAGLYHF